jgi:hypothetical protein
MDITLKEIFKLHTESVFYGPRFIKNRDLVGWGPDYKPEGRGFDFWWFHLNFLSTYSFWMHCGPRIDSSSKENEYQEYFLDVKAAGA